jgi:hypothetical protein
MEIFSSAPADLHLFAILFGFIAFMAISDFLEYRRKKDKNKKKE